MPPYLDDAHVWGRQARPVELHDVGVAQPGQQLHGEIGRWVWVVN